MASQSQCGISLDQASTEIGFPSLKCSILRAIFDLDLTEHELQRQHTRFEAFFDWYGEQCESVATEIGITSHREILDVIDLLKSAYETRTSAVGKFRQSRTTLKSDEQIDGLVMLAARLWLMLLIGDFQQCSSPGQTLAWGKNRRLFDVVAAEFTPNTLSDQIKLPAAFNAANVERIAGIRIIWTSNLAEHLVLKDDDTKLMLFHQISVLELHKQSQRY